MFGESSSQQFRDSEMKITAWDREHFQKSLSVNKVPYAIHKCRLKLCHASSGGVGVHQGFWNWQPAHLERPL